MALDTEKHMLLTTFCRDNTPEKTPEFDAVWDEVKSEYGFTTHISKLLGTLGGIVKGKRIPYGDRGVVITPAG